MAIAQPLGTDLLNSPDHAKQHRVIASDPSASDQTITVDASNNVKLGSLAGILKGTAGTVSAVSPVTVSDGGTGISTATAYAVICAGTTATGAFQNVSGLGTSGYVLISAGAGALPAWGLNAPLIRGTFTNATLTAGVLTLTHNRSLAAPYMVNVVIFDNTYKQVLPDSVEGATNTFSVDLGSYVTAGGGSIPGTWGYGYIV
jgi:hypothetical protein